jgi:hypothetical protein
MNITLIDFFIIYAHLQDIFIANMKDRPFYFKATVNLSFLSIESEELVFKRHDHGYVIVTTSNVPNLFLTFHDLFVQVSKLKETLNVITSLQLRFNYVALTY